jgi:hypothetical protein
MSLYEQQYAGFGDTRLMSVKLTWDYAYYWSVLAWLFFRELMTDLRFLRTAQNDIMRVRARNDLMQAAFRQRAAERRIDRGSGRFVDQISIPILLELNAALLTPQGSFEQELQSNCARLDRLAPLLLSILEAPARRASGGCALLGDLELRLA